MPATSDAARPFFGSPARAREEDRRNAWLSSALLLRAFSREFRIENFCSSVSVCFVNERVQLRRRASAIDAFARKGRRFLKIVCESTHMESGGGIYDDKIARCVCLFGLFTFQNCADQFCVCVRVTCAKSIEVL